MTLNRVTEGMLGFQNGFNEQTFVSTAGQTVFTLTNGSYQTGKRRIEVEVGGAPQHSGTNFTETSATSFTVTEALPAGITVYAKWYESILPAVGGHASQHKAGGADELQVKDLKGFGNDYGVNVKWYGAKGDGLANEDDAVFNAINALPSVDSFTLIIPSGVYKLTRPLYLTRPIKIAGDGIGSTVLDFSGMTTPVNAPYNCAIVVVHPGNIPGGSQGSPNPIILPAGQVGTDGIDAQITGLSVVGLPGAANQNGIFINAPAQLMYVEVKNFSNHGFLIGANGNIGGLDIEGNANHTELQYCQSRSNGGNGFYTIGSDANTFVLRQCLSNANGGWGVSDDSLLGGLVLGCEADSNVAGAYTSSTSKPSRTVWLGNYAEAGTQTTYYSVNGRNLILGATGAQPEAGQPYIGSVIDKGAVSYRPLFIADTDQQAYDIGGTTGTASRLNKDYLLIRPVVGKGLFRFGSDINSSNYAGIFLDDVPVIRVPLLNVTGNIVKNRPLFSNGVSFGTRSAVIGEASTIPVSVGSLGEITMNSNPTPGGFLGWVYTASGWKGFGLIQT